MSYDSGRGNYEVQSTGKNAAKPHGIIVEERRRMSVTGVEDVESFDDTEITMHTAQGLLVLKGSGLQIDRLSTDTGEVNIQGLITELSYMEAAPSGSLWTKLFR